MGTKSIIPKLIGTWKLEDIFYKTIDNKKINLYGSNPKGILMYDKHGYMNAQIVNSDRTWFEGKDQEDPNYIIASHNSITSYFGKYYEKEPGVIIHKVEGCTNPSWEGSDLVRFLELNQNTLYIYTPETIINGIKTKIEVYWKRI